MQELPLMEGFISIIKEEVSVAANQSENLIALNNLDRSVVQKENTLKEKTLEVESIRARFLSKSKILEKLQLDFEKATEQHSSAENQLKDEEVKIVERRKQLTSLGGAKSAKLVERELDIAKRIMETLEENVLTSMGQLESLSSKRELILSEVDTLKTNLAECEGSLATIKDSVEAEIKDLKANRIDLLKTLDQRLQSLYKRVEGRYRGDAIASAEKGACRNCFRSLPAQMFNQILAGYNLIQCPGCSRILYHVAEQEQSESAVSE